MRLALAKPVRRGDDWPRIFVSHAGEQKKGFVSHLQKALDTDDLLRRIAFVDEWNLQPSDNAPKEMQAVCHGCDVGVVILSPEYIRKPYPMEELVILHDRWVKDEVKLLVVYYNQALEDLKGIHSKYKQPSFWEYNRKQYDRPEADVVLQKWADTLKNLSTCTSLRMDQVQNEAEQVDKIVKQCHRLLGTSRDVLPRHTFYPLSCYGGVTLQSAIQNTGDKVTTRSGYEVQSPRAHTGHDGEPNSAFWRGIIGRVATDMATMYNLEEGPLVEVLCELSQSELLHVARVENGGPAALLNLFADPLRGQDLVAEYNKHASKPLSLKG